MKERERERECVCVCTITHLVFVDEACYVQTQCWNGTEYRTLSTQTWRGEGDHMNFDLSRQYGSIGVGVVFSGLMYG